ncbi:MAG: hypothetical protein M3220_21180 [Chloroflexota bacterium]|nr:hypothetical protein [Chloroflexota bacterium]
MGNNEYHRDRVSGPGLETMTPLRRELLVKIEALPEDYLAKVFEYVSFLEWQKRTGQDEDVEAADLTADLTNEPANNPLLGLIGKGSYEPVADKVDEELYGT